jgi:hypothetical protein
MFYSIWLLAAALGGWAGGKITGGGRLPTFSSESRALLWFVGPLRTSVFPRKMCTYFYSRSAEQPHSRLL